MITISYKAGKPIIDSICKYVDCSQCAVKAKIAFACMEDLGELVKKEGLTLVIGKEKK